jgi:hypothetical protein
VVASLKTASLYFLVASFCVFATSSIAAKHPKHRSHTPTAKHRSVTPTAKQNPVISTDRTPTNKNDCIAVAEAVYQQAETLSKRIKQVIPPSPPVDASGALTA